MAFNRYCEFLDRMRMLDRFGSQSPVLKRKKKLYRKRFNPITELSEGDFRSKYRFSKSSIDKLIAIVRNDLEGDKRGGRIPAELQVMAALRYWGHNEVQGDAAGAHGFSQPSLSIICARVAKAFASKAKQFIAMPKTALEQKQVIDKFKAISGFPEVIGAIGCTHIRIKKQGGENGQDYFNRKGYYSINVQAVCDPNLKIRDIVCHLRGSTHASSIYDGSAIKSRLEKGEFNGRLLGDGGYLCSEHLFTPLPNPSNSSEEKYNNAHIATRGTIDGTFIVWKSRFRILLTGMRGSLENVKITVLALSVLHNLAVEYNDVLDTDEDFNEIINDNDDISLPSENQQLSDGQETSRTGFIGTYFEKLR